MEPFRTPASFVEPISSRALHVELPEFSEVSLPPCSRISVQGQRESGKTSLIMSLLDKYFRNKTVYWFTHNSNLNNVLPLISDRNFNGFKFETFLYPDSLEQLPAILRDLPNATKLSDFNIVLVLDDLMVISDDLLDYIVDTPYTVILSTQYPNRSLTEEMDYVFFQMNPVTADMRRRQYGCYHFSVPRLTSFNDFAELIDFNTLGCPFSYAVINMSTRLSLRQLYRYTYPYTERQSRSVSPVSLTVEPTSRENFSYFTTPSIYNKSDRLERPREIHLTRPLPVSTDMIGTTRSTTSEKSTDYVHPAENPTTNETSSNVNTVIPQQGSERPSSAPRTNNYNISVTKDQIRDILRRAVVEQLTSDDVVFKISLVVNTAINKLLDGILKEVLES
jgi:hypothetical protein